MTCDSILHIGKYYPPHMGGIESYIRDLAVSQKTACSVNVFVANDAPTMQSSVVDGVCVRRLPSLGNVASMPICPTLPWNLRGRTDAIVHMHLPNPGAALSFLLSGHPGKLIITHHGDTVGRQFLRKFSDPFVKTAMERASAIIVTSNRYLESSNELRPFRRKARVIPLGIDSSVYEEDWTAEAKQIASVYGSPLILSVGRLVPYKGFEYLIRAMQQLEAQLLLVGSGPLSAGLQRLVQQQGLTHRVHLIGHVPNIAPYYKAADIFVLPSISRAESFGIVQLEAMAAGIPVVNTNIDSGVPEVSIDRVTGLTAPRADPVALAESLNLLLRNSHLRKQYGLAGRYRVRERFTLSEMTSATMNLYDEVLGKRSPAQTKTG